MVPPAAPLLLAESAPANPWFSWSYVTDNWDAIAAATKQHIALTVWAVGIALVISVPLAVIARQFRWARGPILTTTGVIYTIPSLALFAALVPVTGLTPLTVEIGLVGYALLVMVRNILTGLESVPPDVREAARGMGIGPVRMFLTVDLPLALPAIMAGVRVATVSTIALVTVGALVGYGGLGGLILEGLNSLYRAQIMTASLMCVLLAMVADVLLLGLQRVLTPWSRRRAA